MEACPLCLGTKKICIGDLVDRRVFEDDCPECVPAKEGDRDRVSAVSNIQLMTVSELRDALLPYGTPYRLSMKRSELQKKLTEIRENEAAGMGPDPDPHRYAGARELRKARFEARKSREDSL